MQRHVPFSQRDFPVRALIGLALACFLGAGAASAGPEPGRTDGEEGSEYGKGGYPYYGRLGQFYAEGFFGAAMVDIDPEDEAEEEVSSTDLMSGLYLGYKIEEWLSFQAGYGRIGGDSAANLFSAGMRNSLDLRPFNYFFSLDAELYSPTGGDVRFGIVPGAGAEMFIGDRVQVGLRYQRDFIFADDDISINRFTARVQVNF